MFNQKNYISLMKVLIFSIWVLYGLNWVFSIDLLTASIISTILDISLLLLLTLMVVILNYISQNEKEDKGYKHKKMKTDKSKKLKRDLKRSGFSPEDLKDYLKE
ncbi:MAG: hypothetical protein ACFFD2_23740 [Promethearchaeota archaeon]